MCESEMEDGASGEMAAAGGQGAAAGGRRGGGGGGGGKRGRGERESGGATASASRICRGRANGGKDRHSKVVTSKGVRDRRVRLAVPTAIQFYDLQDRLGFDQPSKAVDWLLDAASHAIAKLPPLDPTAFSFPFPADDAQQATKKGKKPLLLQQGSSSTTSESDLSLSRSDAARDKQHKGAVVTVAAAPGSAQAASSFTELLSGNAIAAAEHIQSWYRQQQRQLSAAGPVGFAAHPGNNNRGASQDAACAGLRFGNAPPLGMAPARPLLPVRPVGFPTANSTGEIAPFSFVQGVLAAASAQAPAPAGDYSLDFSMSSGFTGGGVGSNSRGTLQSNSRSQYFSNQLQLYELDGPSPPFLYDPAAALAAHPSSENRHLTGTPPLQLWNGFRMEEKSQN
ncbi:transcription factor PCF6 [Brachypodium distachyon]|uniref:TCP domain-containing protein n=1 Tax=Brachypodium distachyon TaxID=15368 RepID=A0A0Q3GPA3_BRADI|nr:transcription factor PCF6 [Brachypodium distachyon]KQK12863.1 hypothetical protein BRADI_1g06460v3 [Brachypodium distachyon]|eukprot:XP_003559357.3 transcription factor PCF6 [Brachypodium distachyon]